MYFRFLLAVGLLSAGLRAHAADIAFTLTDVKDGKPVADAVVSLVPLDAPAKFVPPATPVEIVQKGQEFIPYVTAVMIGAPVAFPNRDTVKHTIYSNSGATRFSFPFYEPGKAEKVVFDKPGVVGIGCNVHDWMLAYVVVLETPWFSSTAAAGAATIAGVPAGNYRLEVWHPRLSKLHTQPLAVAEGANAAVALKLPLGRDQRIRRRVEAGAGGYK